jgi:hypothetical protein
VSRVVAVVLNWNGGARTLAGLRALEECGARDLRVIVVDNGSTDGSPDAVASEFPRVRLVRLPSNLGYCEGNNAGIREALAEGAEYVLLLNDDVAVEPGFLGPLLAAATADPRAGALGPKVVLADAPDTIWAVGGSISFGPNTTRLLGHRRRDDGAFDRAGEVDYVPGCALLLRAQALRQVGGFDPAYFAYMEDVEFGVRLRRAGWRSIVAPASRVRHAPSSSTGGGYGRARKYANAVNQVRFLRRHGTPLSWIAFLLFDVLGLPVALARELLRRGGRPDAVLAKARGLLDGWRDRRVSAGTFGTERGSGSVGGSGTTSASGGSGARPPRGA